MRVSLRLHGSTEEGQKCQAEISVYAENNEELQRVG